MHDLLAKMKGIQRKAHPADLLQYQNLFNRLILRGFGEFMILLKRKLFLN